MSEPTCSQTGCYKPVKSRGVCNAHYLQLRKTGELPRVRDEQHKISDVDLIARTGTCSRCGPTRIHLRSGRNPLCMTKRRQQRGTGARTAMDRRRWKYGLTAGQMRELIESSGGRCAICDSEFGDNFHVDHCHETREVRGLLCARCNYGLGWFDDSLPRLLSAYLYLKASGKAEVA